MNTIRLSVRPALGWLRPLLKIGTTLGVAIGLAIALVGSLWAPTALAACAGARARKGRFLEPRVKDALLEVAR